MERKKDICSNFKMDSLLQKYLGGENLRMMSEGGASLSETSDDVDHAGREAHLQGEGSQGKSGQGGLKIRDVKTDVFLETFIMLYKTYCQISHVWVLS